MLDRLLSLLRRPGPPPAPLPEPDARLALGALLVRVALADRSYLFEEVRQIDRILADAYDLGPIDAARMRATCETLAFSAESDLQLAAFIRDGVDYDHRLQTVRALWRVARADGIDDARERALVDLVEEQLGIIRSDAEAARTGPIDP